LDGKKGVNERIGGNGKMKRKLGINRESMRKVSKNLKRCVSNILTQLEGGGNYFFNRGGFGS
jgi:hypothetical protein